MTSSQDEYKAEIRKELEALLKEGKLLRTIKTISAGASDPCPIWSNFFFKQAVTVQIGDPGIGKTTFDYSLLTTISKGEPFLNIKPVKEVKSLYLDFESSDSLVKIREKRIDSDDEFPNFQIMNYSEYSYENLEEFIPIIKKEYFDFDMLFIDNMLTAFDTADENDNAEAKKKVKKMRIMAQQLDVSISILHHPSKANAPGTRKGSGAFAWSRHGDILLNFNLTEDSDVFEIETAKNRWAETHESLYIRKCGDCVFQLTPEPNGIITPETDLGKAKQIILSFVGKHKRREIIQYCINRNILSASANKALWELTKDKSRKVLNIDYGFYEIVS